MAQKLMPETMAALDMCIGLEGDTHGASTAERANVVADITLHIIGVSRHFGPNETLEVMCQMKLRCVHIELNVMEGRPAIYHTTAPADKVSLRSPSSLRIGTAS